MDYLSVKEIAELWGVSIRMVNYYLNTGRIQGAIRKSGGWLIPANTPHPADLRKSGQRGQEKIPPRMAKCYMPLISRPCDNGFQNLLLTMNDEEERDIARALHHYFRDEHEEAREISEKYLTSKCPEIRADYQHDGDAADGGCRQVPPESRNDSAGRAARKR